jgi:RNA polymerase sigma-70 factor (ECF subfamily)
MGEEHAPVVALSDGWGTDTEETLDRLAVARLVAGDEHALAELYDRHARLAYALAYRVVGDGGAAEEVVQETFLSMWRRAVTYCPDRGAVRTWLLAAVRHRAIDVLRMRQARPRTASLDTVRLATGSDPAVYALTAMTASAVRTAVAGLPLDQRRVVAMAYFAGYSYPEIAVALGIPLGTVKSRLRLALERLRRVLEAVVLETLPQGG